VKLTELARRLGLTRAPSEGIRRAQKDIADRSAAEQFRARRGSAFKGILTYQQALNLYEPTRLDLAQERILAGGMARMDQTARRLAARAAEEEGFRG
jgi:hypothetical protein